jgi:hypothetical protein
MVTRMANVGDSSFSVRTQAEEAQSVPGPERVSWVAFSTASDASNNVGTTGKKVKETDFSISLTTD